MKKGAQILIVLLCALLVFPSCDAGINFLGMMGKNVLGTDTSKATQAVESATVNEEEIKTAEDDERIDTTSGKITLAGMEVTVTTDSISSVESLLPAISENTVNEIVVATKNTDSVATLVTSMQEPATEATTTAAKGTATVMKAVLDTYVEDFIGSGSESGADNSTIEAVKGAITSLTTSLDSIVSGEREVTKGDVVTLQLIENFATQVVAAVDTTTKEFNTEKLPELLSSANTLASVTTSLSAASVFELNLSDLISQALGATSGSSSRSISARDIAEEGASSTAKPEIIANIENVDLTQWAGVIRGLYQQIVRVLGTDKARSASSLSLHKNTYETYVSLVDHANQTSDRAFKSFATYDGFIKYVIASMLSEFNRYYGIILANKDDIGMADIALPDTVWEVLDEIAAKNDWLTRDTGASNIHLYIPEEYYGLFEGIVEVFSKSENSGDAFVDLVIENANPLISMLDTVVTMLDVVNVSNILGMVGGSTADFEEIIQGYIDWLKGTTV